MNREEYKAKKKELKEQLKELDELARMDRLKVGREAALILEKERRHLKKELRKKVSGDE